MIKKKNHHGTISEESLDRLFVYSLPPHKTGESFKTSVGKINHNIFLLQFG
jgi:hypothetical protein